MDKPGPLASLRLTGQPAPGRAIYFIHVVRYYSGITLAEAKPLLDRLMQDGEIELHVPDAQARVMGQEFLRLGVAKRVELIRAGPSSGEPIELSPPPPPPPQPVYSCPSCQQKLRDRNECAECGWLRFAADRERWGTKGQCPRCGFAYRWDGERCAHCGHGAG